MTQAFHKRHESISNRDLRESVGARQCINICYHVRSLSETTRRADISEVISFNLSCIKAGYWRKNYSVRTIGVNLLSASFRKSEPWIRVYGYITNPRKTREATVFVSGRVRGLTEHPQSAVIASQWKITKSMTYSLLIIYIHTSPPEASNQNLDRER